MEGLPPDGALGRAVTGSVWGLSDHRDADMVDELGRIFTVLYNAHRAEGAPVLPWPELVPRPGDPTPQQRAKAKAREARAAREGYEDIVSQVAPGRI
ncbi:hypothetical protein [Streptomyces sp. NPDC052114]|uniref:hypothetical protein n=1 Tax=unclassified Streptomyces TaxID=2593676 RepID=UPI003430F5FA